MEENCGGGGEVCCSLSWSSSILHSTRYSSDIMAPAESEQRDIITTKQTKTCKQEKALYFPAGLGTSRGPPDKWSDHYDPHQKKKLMKYN